MAACQAGTTRFRQLVVQRNLPSPKGCLFRNEFGIRTSVYLVTHDARPPFLVLMNVLEMKVDLSIAKVRGIARQWLHDLGFLMATIAYLEIAQIEGFVRLRGEVPAKQPTEVGAVVLMAIAAFTVCDRLMYRRAMDDLVVDVRMTI